MTTYEGIANPIRLRNGLYFDIPGTYWAWPVDGYFDLHHTDVDVEPDGSEVIEELLPTLKAARAEARSLHQMFLYDAMLKKL